MGGLGDFKTGDIKNAAMDAAKEHDDKLDAGAEKAGQFADEKTGGQHTDKIDGGVDKVQGAIDGGENPV